MRARFLSSTSLPKPSRRLSRWCALALAAAGAGAIAAAPAGQPGFEESTQVTLVQIPVQVTRGGEPVRGLSAADFEVYDGKTRQAITGFEVVDLASPANQRLAANVPAAARRHFLLLFDLAFSEPKSITKAQEAARDVMLKQLVPSDLVAVATYSHSVGARLVLGFTSDRRQVLAAITHFGLPELVDRSGDPLRLMADEYKAQLQSPSEAAASSKGPGGVLSQMLAQALEESARANERAERQNALQVVAAMTHSLSDLGNLMASVSGRKEVIYFSEGFDGSLLQGTTDTKEREDQAQSIAFGQTENVDSDVLYGNSHQNNEMEKMLESFRRSDCVIQSIDIAGLRGNNDQAAHGKNGEIVLFEMAKDTGGELFHSFNDLGEAMQRLLKQTSLTYVLNIQPAGLKSDGAYHKLRVELKSAPRGTQVSFRKGYYAPRPYTKESPMERDLAAASALMGGDRGGTVDVEVLAAPFHTTAEKAYVPVLIETDGASLLSGSTGTVLPTEIYVYAADAQGQILDYFDQAMRFDLAKTPPTLRQGGLKFFGHLELQAGNYWLRVLVRNGATGAYGMRAVPLSVPAFGEAGPVLLPPFFPETPGRWMVVREPPRGAQKDAAYPFMVADHAYIPASRPELAPGQQSLLALVGYNWGTGAVKAEAHVTTADGRDLGPVEMQVSGREDGEQGKPDRWRGSWRLPQNLAPGEYELVVTVSPAGGGPAQSSSGAFAVAAPAKAGGGV